MLSGSFGAALVIALLASTSLAETPSSTVIRPQRVDAKVKGCQVSEPGAYRATAGALIELEYTFPIVPTTMPKRVAREWSGGAVSSSPLGVRHLVVPNRVGTGTYLFYFRAQRGGSGTANLVIDDVKYAYRFTVEQKDGDTTSRDAFLGEIRMTAFNFAPRGWAFCDGQVLPIGQYEALFSLVGTMYGGDGRTTFGLPDLRGRTPIHAGEAPRLAKVRQGQAFGGEQAAVAGGGEGATTRPYLGLRYIIALYGVYPSRDGKPSPVDGFTSEIGMFACSFAPRGWAACDGQLLEVSKHRALFDVIGRTYGGNETHFRVPDLRGRIPVHAGDGPGLDPVQRGEQRSGAKVAVGKDPDVAVRTRATLGIQYAIALDGVDPDPEGRGKRGTVEGYIGEIRAIAGGSTPTGWAPCDGQILPIAQHTAVFSLLGTMYGGDGRSTLGLPDLRGRTPVHAGAGPGLAAVEQGQRGGGYPAMVATESDDAASTQPYLGIRYLVAITGRYPSRN